MVVEVTYKCTHDCVFCYNCWKHEYPVAPELTTTQFTELISRLPSCNQIALSGGEPLFRKDILELARAAKKRAGRVSLCTTGELLSPGIADRLARLGILVQIPLHGTERTHELLTRKKGSYRKALEAMTLLAEKKIPFGTSTVVCKQNIGEFPTVLALSAAMGAHETIAIRFLPGGEGLKCPEQMISRQDGILMLDHLEDASKRYGLRTAIGVPNLPCVIDEKPYKRIIFGACGAGKDWFTVDPSGRMRICNHSPTIIGDLVHQELSELWNHPILENMRRSAYTPKECFGCSKILTCGGGCRAVGETFCQSLSAPDPFFSHRPSSRNQTGPRK